MTATGALVRESWVADRAAVDAWLREAKAGDRLTYARGGVLPATSQTANRLRALQQMGMVRLHFAGGEHVAVRRAAVRSTPPSAKRYDRPVADGKMTRVLRVLRACANATPPLACPPNREIGRQAGGLNASQASHQFGRLVDARIIASEIVDAVSGQRVVTILATGKRTAAPEESAK